MSGASHQAGAPEHTRQVVCALADAALDPVVVSDLCGSIVCWNQLAADLFGWPASVRGESIGALLVPERYRELHARGLARYAASGRSHLLGRCLPLQALCSDGREVPVEMRLARIDGEQPLLVAFLRDLRASTRAQSRTSQAEAFAESVLAALDAQVAVVSREGTIVAVNERWRQYARMYGSEASAMGVGASYVETCRRAQGLDAAVARQMQVGLRAVLERVRERFTLDYPYDVHGARRWFTMVVTPMRAPFQGAVVAHTDVTERRATEEALRSPARADSLTGLPTRVLFADRVGQALLQRQRDRGQLAVLFLDLDRFKAVNDTLGHQAGDVVLCEVAHRLRRALRKSDTVARIGGDEFVVLLPEIAGPDAAATVARKLLDVLEPPIAVEEHRMRVTASIGIVLGPAHASDVSTLLRKADIAMYAAKRSGGGFSFDSHDEPDASPEPGRFADDAPGLGRLHGTTAIVPAAGAQLLPSSVSTTLPASSAHASIK